MSGRTCFVKANGDGGDDDADGKDDDGHDDDGDDGDEAVRCEVVGSEE